MEVGVGADPDAADRLVTACSSRTWRSRWSRNLRAIADQAELADDQVSAAEPAATPRAIAR